jgi:hypothetical protein
MRRYRAFGVAVCAATLAVSGCNQNPLPASPPVAAQPAPVPVATPPPPIFLSHEGFAGHSINTGDTLTWAVLDEGKPYSYELTFPKKNPACNLPPTAKVTVTPTQSFSCPAKPPTDGYAVYYKIKAIKTPPAPVTNPTPAPLPPPPPGPPRPFCAIPCRLCYQ